MKKNASTKTGTTGSKLDEKRTSTDAAATKTDTRGPRNKRLGRKPNLYEKAEQLLADGHVTVVTIDRTNEIYKGLVKGEHGIYEVRWNRQRLRWECSCPSYGLCSHSRAFQLVVVPT